MTFCLNYFPLFMEICRGIRNISIENKLKKSQIKTILEIKKSFQKAYQHVVNNKQFSDKPKNE